ncbi:MAG: hypothetical protein AAF242_07255 [Bacteroidota bacterium]
MGKVLELVEIGSFGKAIGVKGQIKCKIEEVYQEAFEKSTVVFARIGGQPVPFFVESIESNPEPLLKVEDLNDKEEAQLITGKALWMRKEELPAIESLQDISGQYQQFIGYIIQDINTALRLKIEDFEELPQQVLAITSYEEQTVFIPFAPQLISDINDAQEIIYMDLPEGLLNLN